MALQVVKQNLLFDKIVGNDFERAKRGPKGEIHEVFRNPAGPAIIN